MHKDHKGVSELRVGLATVRRLKIEHYYCSIQHNTLSTQQNITQHQHVANVTADVAGQVAVELAAAARRSSAAATSCRLSA
jgi:hypothetical protein